jgi:hypothetical protein
MRFIEREPVRYVVAGGPNTVTTDPAYLVLLPLIGYRSAKRPIREMRLCATEVPSR